jgi:CelD/BcsL family acetyltransferase involved in cellulose biosynthesis
MQLLTGRTALLELGARLEELHAKAGVPVTARYPWLQTWADHYTEYDLLVVVVAAPGGELRAAGPLAVRRGRGVYRVVPIGDGPSDAIRLPALEPSDAQLLASGIAQALHDLRRPWLLLARNLEPTDLAVDALAAELRWSTVRPGDVSPRLAFQDGRSLRAHVSRNHHQQVRRMHNRLLKDGHQPEIAQLRTPEQLADVWPEVERLCRTRDLQLRGSSGLDDPCFGPFFRSVVATLAARGEVRLTTVRLQGRLASYVLAFQDGRVRRMWNCRVDPALLEYGVGRIGNDEALKDALADPLCDSYDWMRGEEPYKASMSDHRHQAVDLTAASNAPLWGLVSGADGLRSRLRDVRDRGGRAGRVLSRVQHTLHRFDPFR